MKIKVVGSGYTWLTDPNTSFIINDEILFDTPQSMTKFSHMDVAKLKAIFITHFHSDHFVDLHLIVDWVVYNKPNRKVTVYAPHGALKRLLQLYKLIEVKHLPKKVILKYFDFITVKDGDKIEFDSYQVQVVEVKHSTKVAYGYIFKERGSDKVIGFTGDTTQCDGLYKIIDKSNVIFIDTSGTKKSKVHLSRGEVVELMKANPNKTFYSVHVNKDLKDEYTDLLNIARRGQVISVK